MKNHFLKSSGLLLLVCFICTRCTDTALTLTPASNDTSVAISGTSSSASDCSSCTYVVPPNVHIIDGNALGLQPGSVIGLSAGVEYGNLILRNIVGTEGNPVIIKNCGGTAVVNGTGLNYSIRSENSRYFRITGGNTVNSYGIQIVGGQISLALGGLSTNFEIDHLEIRNSGFAGIMAKTDPSCDDATIRGNFVMKNVYFHDNYVHDTGGEAFYIGNSFWDGASTPCGTRLPHEIHYLRLFNNIVKNSGWDGIQVGCATKDAKIYGNTIENYGTQNEPNQRSGIQIGTGTGGVCYGNLINKGTGNGMTVLGLGDNVVHNNVILDAGEIGIFCDERYTPGPGFKFINNTIVRPATDGIRLYAELVPMNVVINNIIVSPGKYSQYTYPRTSDDSFLYLLSKTVRVQLANNFFTTNLNDAGFVNPGQLNYRLSAASGLVDKGADITSFNIYTDYYKKTRLRGAAYDIGAAEYQ